MCYIFTLEIDAASCIITFISSLFLGMEYGILIGVGISIGSLLMKTLAPPLIPDIIEDPVTGIRCLYITPVHSGVNFPSVDHISSTVQKLSLKHRSCRVIVLDFSQWKTYDYTAATTLLSLVKGLKKNGKVFIFTHCSDEWNNALKIAGLAHPPTIQGGRESLSDYLKKNIQPVIALELGLDNLKADVNGGANGVHVGHITLYPDRDLHRSNPSLEEGESSASETSEVTVTTTNSAKGLV